MSDLVNYGGTWHAFECSCGVSWDLRSKPLPDLKSHCPLCQKECKAHLTWPADVNGYGSRGDQARRV